MVDYRLYRDQLHHLHPWPSTPVDANLGLSDYRSQLLNYSTHYQSPDYPSPPLSPHPPSSEHSHPGLPDASLLDPLPQIFPSDHSHGYSSAPTVSNPDDVLLYVGRNRHPFFLNTQSLISGSAYFKKLLQPLHSSSSPTGRTQSGGGFGPNPIVIDCEVHIFESLLLLMRYGSFEALPPMSASEIFRLKKEAEFYGIQYTEPPLKLRAAAENGSDDHSDRCSIRSHTSGSSGSPKSTMTAGTLATDKCTPGKHHEGVRLACCTAERLSDLPEFPHELADPARLVLISCLDQEKASIYACDCSKSKSNGRKTAGGITQWALSFHHRHAFCTACGEPASLSPKHFAEIFMAASLQYYAPASGAGRLMSSADQASSSGWQVSADSTCLLRFVSSAGDGRDVCGCAEGGRKAAKQTIWAANCFYGHAFCTSCGEVAKGPVLLDIILALRYRGSPKISRSARSSFRSNAPN